MREWEVSLPRFEGPVDLLLSLVRRNQLDLADLPVAEVSRQYLDYLRQAEKLDVNLGAEYADMAATLIQLKSRMLLPMDPELAAREPDPRQSLVRQLLDREQVRQAAEFLEQKLALAEATWSRPAAPAAEHGEDDPPPADGKMNLLDVVRLARRALNTARVHQSLDLDPEPVTMDQMIRWIEDRVGAGGHEDARTWFDEQDSDLRRVLLFLAMLELSRVGRIELQQDLHYGMIAVAPAARPVTPALP